MINHANEALALIDSALEGFDTTLEAAKTFLTDDDKTERGDLLDRAFPYVADDEIMQRAGQFYDREGSEFWIQRIHDSRDRGYSDVEMYRFFMERFPNQADAVRYVFLGIGKAPKSRLLAQIERGAQPVRTVVTSNSPARQARRTVRRVQPVQPSAPVHYHNGVACTRHPSHVMETERVRMTHVHGTYPNTGIPRTNLGRVRNEDRDERDLSLLKLIGVNTVSVPVLAAWMEITPAKVRASIKRMRDAGYVCSPQRARFALTDAGLQRIGQ